MKKTLLFLFSIITSLIYAQEPINNYFSVPGSDFAIVSQTVDQSASGANAAWGFGALTQTGTNEDTFAATDPNIGDYPGTTQVLTINDGTTSSQVFYKVVGSTLSLTGASNPEFTLNYNTDNALVGTYPLTYANAATNDAIAGTISALGQTAAFTGTINTEVDAYGTLSFTVTGQGSYSGNVTRIKTTQSVSFSVFGFQGTASIDNYNYYKDSDGALVFRTTDGAVSVPVLNINETFSSTEALITNTLSVADNTLVENSVKLYPNPVQETLYIKQINNVQVSAIQIMDLSGREVLTVKGNQNVINLSSLHSGLYLVKMTTSEGNLTKKIIKK
jgi:hypothetical protein